MQSEYFSYCYFSVICLPLASPQGFRKCLGNGHLDRELDWDPLNFEHPPQLREWMAAERLARGRRAHGSPLQKR